MPRIYTVRLTVPEDVIDVNRHVNNLAYLRWMQDVATAHSDAQGWPFERYTALGAGWFVRSHFIEYLRPAYFGDALAVHTWVAAFTPGSSTRHYLFVRDGDGRHVARAKTLWVWVDFATGRPARIPSEVAGSFPVVADDGAEVMAFGAGARPAPTSAL